MRSGVGGCRPDGPDPRLEHDERDALRADRNLFYVTGGAAVTRVSYTQNYADTLNTGIGSLASAKLLAGWTAGAGWEYALSRHATFRVEYLFADFPTIGGSGAITDAVAGSNAFRGSADLVIQAARADLNYKF
jgi:outer membrane immunogenic protein